MLKKGLFLFVFACLCLPLVQQAVPFFESKPLRGYFTIAADTSFSWSGWLEGTYQHKKEAYLNDHAGFRPDLIRIKDQLDYSLYNRLDYSGAVPGKKNCLYFNDYILAYTGVDYSGDSVISAKMIRLRALQDTFARMGKSLVLVFSPNKAFYYADYLPDNRKAIGAPTNYQSYLRIGDSLDIHQIDFNAWFMGMRKTSKELLMSKAGTHWTVYGAILAGDSLVRYVERARGVHIPHATWSKTEHLYGARQTDDDIEKSANLLFPLANERYCYPLLKYPDDTTAKKPRVILIGDSFVFTLLTNGLPQHSFKDWQFWFYFDRINNDRTPIGCGEENPLIENYNWQGAIDSTDCIVLMYTSINLSYGRNELGSGFIEREYDHYFPVKKDVSTAQ